MNPVAALKKFIAQYQHQLSIGAFVVGFCIDTLVLKRIDLLISNVLLLTYLGTVVVVMVLLHRAATHTPYFDVIKRLYLWLPFVAQFAFGGMFSGFLIFYSQSGSFISSWPFILLIIMLIFINEFLRTYQQRLTYQSLLLFFCLFSFSIYALPIFLGRMGDDVFEYSGLAAVAAFSVFVLLLYSIDARRVRMSLGSIVVGTLAVYGLITALYFSNVLPPIPLALKDIGVYHSVVRAAGGYEVQTEPQSWYARLLGVTVMLEPSASLFAYSSVFAPTRLTTSIVHRWERFDTARQTWVTVSTIPFGIFGGRDGGYRGYSELGPLSEGLWRVNVETTRGQLIGREAFTIVHTLSTPQLTTRILQ
jgi:hypothetical protein